MTRTRRTIPLGKPVSVVRADLDLGGGPEIVVDPSFVPRRKDNFPSPDFEPSGVETEGLPPGVRIRWFRSLVARPFVVARDCLVQTPPGAIVWSEESPGTVAATGAFPDAAAVAALPPAQEGPRTLSEPGADAPAAPTLREAVAGALEAVPAALREGASAEVEGALAAVGV